MNTATIQTITFGGDGNAKYFQQTGWSAPEVGYTWSIGPECRMALPAIDAPAGFLLELTCIIFKPVHVEVRVNDATVAACLIDAPGTFVWRVPPTNGPVPIRLQVLHPDAQRPSDFTQSNDGRPLGLQWRCLRVLLPDESGALQPAADLPTDPELALEFASLGDDCEFGLVQRALRAEPLSLLRFSTAHLPHVVRGVSTNWEALGEQLSAEVENGEWMTREHGYVLRWHTFQLPHATDRATLLDKERRKTSFLRRKLIEDVANAEHIFVVKSRDAPATLEQIETLHRALNRDAPNWLLWVTADGKPGSTAMIAPRLIRGHVSRFVRQDHMNDYVLADWLAVMRGAWRFARGDHRRGPAIGTIRAPGYIADVPGGGRGASEDHATAARSDGPAAVGRRSQRWSWMLSGWMASKALGINGSGTEFVTVAVPDDFYAVRVGLPNIGTTPWQVSKIVACGSARWNDYVNPLDQAGAHRTSDAWSVLKFENAGADRSSLTTRADAATSITVAGNLPDPASGETADPAWTFTDWTPCCSVGADPKSGMRVLMLRALVPGGQTVCHTNGTMERFSGHPDVNKGYDYFIGGLKYHHDSVTVPDFVPTPPDALRENRLANGPIMCLIQVMTRSAGIVGMVTGDSHQAGSTTVGEINGFLTQCLLSIGQQTTGSVPIGIVCTAVGGAVSRQMFPRLTALLKAVRPAFAVLPGWSSNERDGTTAPTQKADDILFARMLLAADEVRAAGAIPVFVTPLPVSAALMTSERHATWLARRETMLGMRASGALVVDGAALLGEQIGGTLTGTYREGLSSDEVHPNAAGHAIVAEALAPIVRRIAGLA